MILLLSWECASHTETFHQISSSSDLLGVDSHIHSYSVTVPAPQSLRHQLVVDSQAGSRKAILPTPLPNMGPRQGRALPGTNIRNKLEKKGKMPLLMKQLTIHKLIKHKSMDQILLSAFMI